MTRNGTIALLLVLLSLAVSARSEARSLAFPGTPIRQVTAPGDWGDRVDGGADPGVGARYSSSNGELGVVVLDAAVPPETLAILSSDGKALSAAQILELGKSQNPSSLRRCVERVKPHLTRLQERTLLLCEFVQDERIRIAGADGKSTCLPAFKYEAHAFTVDGGKLVHIYLIRSVIRDAQSPAHETLMGSVSTLFRSVLSSIQWEPVNDARRGMEPVMKRPECIMKLSKATSFDSATIGEAVRPSANHAAYAEASSMILGLKTGDLNWLLEHGTPAGRLYGAVLLWQSSRVGPGLSYGKLLSDNAAVEFHSGCEVETTTVKSIAGSFMERNSYGDFKVGMACKFIAPVDKNGN